MAVGAKWTLRIQNRSHRICSFLSLPMENISHLLFSLKFQLSLIIFCFSQNTISPNLPNIISLRLSFVQLQLYFFSRSLSLSRIYTLSLTTPSMAILPAAKNKNNIRSHAGQDTTLTSRRQEKDGSPVC